MSSTWSLLLAMQLLRPVDWVAPAMLDQVAEAARREGWTVEPERLSLLRESSGKWTLRFEAPSGQVRLRTGVPLSAESGPAADRLLQELVGLLGPFRFGVSSPPADLEPTAVVRARRRLDLLLDVGRAAGFRAGTTVRLEDPRGGRGLGRIIEVGDTSTKVRVDLNSPIGVGARAVESVETDAPMGLPGRPVGATELRASAAFLFSSTLELRRPGMFLQLGLTHRFESPWALALEVDPFFLTSDPRSNPEDLNAPRAVVAGAARALFLWDRPLFALGLGPGVASFNSVPVGGTNPPPTDVDAVAPQAGVRLRFGAVDGLMLEMTSGVSFIEGVQLGDVQAIFQIPFGNGILGRLEGGGGPTGFTMGSFGVRWLLRGSGLAPSWFMTGRLGAATVRWQQRNEPFDRLEFSGALIGLELARRF
ncbi:MAG: hypothetical protein AAGD10_09755 [Myxococcota bacterium]